ncbi:hypothetical protein HDU76_003582, partial [Blyttiomyces sp. JEL0837]
LMSIKPEPAPVSVVTSPNGAAPPSQTPINSTPSTSTSNLARPRPPAPPPPASRLTHADSASSKRLSQALSTDSLSRIGKPTSPMQSSQPDLSHSEVSLAQAANGTTKVSSGDLDAPPPPLPPLSTKPAKSVNSTSNELGPPPEVPPLSKKPSKHTGLIPTPVITSPTPTSTVAPALPTEVIEAEKFDADFSAAFAGAAPAATTTSQESLAPLPASSATDPAAMGRRESMSHDGMSIRSAKKGFHALGNMNLDAEFENAFATEAVKPVEGTAVDLATVAAPVKVNGSDFTFDASFNDGAADAFSTAFPAPSDRKASVAASAFSGKAAFVDFDSAFDSSFGATTTATTTVAASTTGAKAAFDDAFAAFDLGSAPVSSSAGKTNALADLDAAFGVNTSSVAAAPTTSGSAGFAFDDADFANAFGDAKPAAAVDAIVGGEAQAEPKVEEIVAVVSEMEDGMTDEVKELMGMGFSKEQSIAALEKNSFDVRAASNFLIDGSANN